MSDDGLDRPSHPGAGGTGQGRRGGSEPLSPGWPPLDRPPTRPDLHGGATAHESELLSTGEWSMVPPPPAPPPGAPPAEPLVPYTMRSAYGGAGGPGSGGDGPSYGNDEGGGADLPGDSAGGAGGRRSRSWMVAAAILLLFAGIIVWRVGDTGDTDTASVGDSEGAAADERSEARADTTTASTAAPTTTTTAAPTTTTTARLPTTGDCARADTANPPAYVFEPCESPQAEVMLSAKVPYPPAIAQHCPGGTDVVLEVTESWTIGGVVQPDMTPEIWCMRNINPPHPGDPGMGGGELLLNDCVGTGPDGAAIEVACDGSGPAPVEQRVFATPDATNTCPVGSIASMTVQSPVPASWCLAAP